MGHTPRTTTLVTGSGAEFYVLSCLHRMGLDAHPTLGNRKGVDIVVLRDDGDAATVEVKGHAGMYEWPAGNLRSPHPEKHFVVLVTFEEKIDRGTCHRRVAELSRSRILIPSCGNTTLGRTCRARSFFVRALGTRMPGG